MTDHVGVGVGANGRADDVVRVIGVAAPVAYGLVGGVFQGLVAGVNGTYLGAQHFHLFHVGPLAHHVGAPHEDDALHVHQRADGGCGHAVLSGSGFGYDACLAHAARQQYLSDGVVDFVCAGVVEVLALEVDAAAVYGRQAPGQIQGEGRPT